MRAILHFDGFDSVSCIVIPLGACIAAAKAGYPLPDFHFDSFHLSNRQTGLTHGPQSETFLTLVSYMQMNRESMDGI